MAGSPRQDEQQKEPEPLPSLVSIAKSAAGYCLQHPALILSLAYLYVSALGMAYASALYSAFGINILDFAETTDFLLAALHQPVALILSAVLMAYFIGAGALLYAGIAVARRPPAWVRESVSKVPVHLPRLVVSYLKGTQKAVSRFAPWYLGLVVVLLLSDLCDAYLDTFSGLAQRQAQRLVIDESAPLVVEIRSSDDAGQSTIIEENLSLIGSTSSFAFFYDHNEQRTQVIPIANILRMYAVPPKPLATPTPTTEAQDAGSGLSTTAACR